MSHTNNREVAIEEIVAELDFCLTAYKETEGHKAIHYKNRLLNIVSNGIKETLHQELQKAREEVWNKIYQYADRELDGEVWLHGSQIIRRAKEDGVIIDQSELDQPTDCTCDGFDTCYKHSEQLDQTFNPTN